MTVPVRIDIRAEPEEVFATLADPRTYPRWLVGAKEIRSVDPGFPAPGARFHHVVGLAGPLTVADSTLCEEVDEPRLLRLEARARPAGRAEVTFTLEPHGGGTRVEVRERAVGLLRVADPALQPAIVLRNRRSLAQLRDLVELTSARG